MADVIQEWVTYAEPVTDTIQSDRSIAEVVELVTTASLDFPAQYVQQKVWDTVEGGWVVWATEAMDLDGMQYPGPGTWGANTSDYRVLNIKFTRVQE